MLYVHVCTYMTRVYFPNITSKIHCCVTYTTIKVLYKNTLLLILSDFYKAEKNQFFIKVETLP